MRISQLLEKFDYELIQGSLETEVSDIIYDSRKQIADVVFVCTTGANFDGHDYVSEVAKAGAKAVIVEKEVDAPEGLTVIRVASSREALSKMSAAFFCYPARQMITIGLTGTKGKTTNSYMIKEALEQAGHKTGIIGTIGAMIGEVHVETKNTTPESYEVQQLLRQMVDAGCEYAVMEVSSQGLKQERVSGMMFDYGVFTNFSADHIGPNEHKDMEEYLHCKSLLFRQCKQAVVNCDDEKWQQVLAGSDCPVTTFGCSNNADLYADNIELMKENGKLGVRFDTHGLVEAKIELFIPGRFNVYNGLVAVVICHLLGISKEDIGEALARVQIRGRVEMVSVSDRFTILIDYAHNELSTRSVMETLKDYNPKRIICIYGCGGNRSKLRRYDMGEVTGKCADLCILTCDNPRDEEIESINADIKVGLARSNGKYIEIEDRKEAIGYAIHHAEPGDIILLLGKGHETYQEIRGVKYHYDEREAIAAVMNEG